VAFVALEGQELFIQTFCIHLSNTQKFWCQCETASTLFSAFSTIFFNFLGIFLTKTSVTVCCEQAIADILLKYYSMYYSIKRQLLYLSCHLLEVLLIGKHVASWKDFFDCYIFK